ncbi:MAG: tRNA lysidine(34) synthetase TilS [Leptolyngbya sp. SIO1E4]|nr:tRNA lysidine(34) synthetase TilS [Leptolyngbya sp. SIO1E4]
MRSEHEVPQALLPKASRVLVAISGGQDSQCLLRLLVDLRDKWRWQLHSVHCNHLWRPDADANAQFVAQLSKEWGVTCTVKTATQPPGSEADARRWRYQTFASVAQKQGCTHVVTGHTASDRAETLLYNLLRGSGADGLQALTRQRPLGENAPDISLVRPLLDVTRAQTAQFCQDYAIPVWQDATNADLTYARNRLRLEVLPLLRTHFNPQVDVTLAQTAEILTAEVTYLSQAAQHLFDRCVKGDAIQRRLLQEAPLALQRRVLRQVLCQRLPTHPQFEHIEKLVALLHASNRSQTDPFPGGAIAYVEDPWIKFNHSPSSVPSVGIVTDPQTPSE